MVTAKELKQRQEADFSKRTAKRDPKFTAALEKQERTPKGFEKKVTPRKKKKTTRKFEFTTPGGRLVRAKLEKGADFDERRKALIEQVISREQTTTTTVSKLAEKKFPTREERITRTLIRKEGLSKGTKLTTDEEGITRGIGGGRASVFDPGRATSRSGPVSSSISLNIRGGQSPRDKEFSKFKRGRKQTVKKDAKQVPLFIESQKIQKLETDIEAQSKRSRKFRGSEGFKRIDKLGSFITLGTPGVPASERREGGFQAQTLATGALSFPFALGGLMAESGEKIFLASRALTIKETRKNTFGELKNAGVRNLETFNPKTREGRSTYIAAGTFGLFGAGFKTKVPTTVEGYVVTSTKPGFVGTLKSLVRSKKGGIKGPKRRTSKIEFRKQSQGRVFDKRLFTDLGKQEVGFRKGDVTIRKGLDRIILERKGARVGKPETRITARETFTKGGVSSELIVGKARSTTGARTPTESQIISGRLRGTRDFSKFLEGSGPLKGQLVIKQTVKSKPFITETIKSTKTPTGQTSAPTSRLASKQLKNIRLKVGKVVPKKVKAIESKPRAGFRPGITRRIERTQREVGATRGQAISEVFGRRQRGFIFTEETIPSPSVNLPALIKGGPLRSTSTFTNFKTSFSQTRIGGTKNAQLGFTKITPRTRAVAGTRLFPATGFKFDNNLVSGGKSKEDSIISFISSSASATKNAQDQATDTISVSKSTLDFGRPIINPIKISSIPTPHPETPRTPRSPFISINNILRIPRRPPPRRPPPRRPPPEETPKKPPPTFKLPSFELDDLKRKKKKKKRNGRGRVFNPGLTASALKIFGKAPKILTGLEIRPIPIGRINERFKF